MIIICNLVLVNVEDAKRISGRLVERKQEMTTNTANTNETLAHLQTIIKW